MTDKFTYEQVKEAVEKSGGFKSEIAKILMCEVRTVDNYFKKYPQLKEDLWNVKEKLIDFVEGKLISQIKEGNLSAMIFYLKTQAKHRGFSERVETQAIEPAKFGIVPNE